MTSRSRGVLDTFQKEIPISEITLVDPAPKKQRPESSLRWMSENTSIAILGVDVIDIFGIDGSSSWRYSLKPE
jgi:hypothetical protein